VRNRSSRNNPAQARLDTHITCLKIMSGSLLFTCFMPGRQAVSLAEPIESKSQKPGPEVPADGTPTREYNQALSGTRANSGAADNASRTHIRNRNPTARQSRE